MSETPREVFEAMLEEWAGDWAEPAWRDKETRIKKRAEWLTRFDAAGIKVPSYVIDECAKEYTQRRSEGRYSCDTDDHRLAFIRGYIACAETFAKGVEGEIVDGPMWETATKGTISDLGNGDCLVSGLPDGPGAHVVAVDPPRVEVVAHVLGTLVSWLGQGCLLSAGEVTQLLRLLTEEDAIPVRPAPERL